MDAQIFLATETVAYVITSVLLFLPALDNFGTDHVQIGTDADASDGGATTSYYVLEDHVAMVDGQTHLDANDQVRCGFQHFDSVFSILTISSFHIDS